MSRFNFSICSCVRPNWGGWKVDSMDFFFRGGSGVGLRLGCRRFRSLHACMHACECGLLCVRARHLVSNKQRMMSRSQQTRSRTPLEKCTKPAVDADNLSIRAWRFGCSAPHLVSQSNEGWLSLIGTLRGQQGCDKSVKQLISCCLIVDLAIYSKGCVN